MDCSMPVFPVHHQHTELDQTQVQWVSDAIQPSGPLLSPSSPAFNPSQNQGLFQWVSSSHQLAKDLSFSFSLSSCDEYSGLIPLGFNGLLTKVYIVKVMAFLVVMYGYESWTIKKSEYQGFDTFELCCCRRLLKVPCTARRSNSSIL